MGFNPCFSGCASRIMFTLCDNLHFKVSILVLVDVPLESGKELETITTKYVSILVLVDVPLE